MGRDFQQLKWMGAADEKRVLVCLKSDAGVSYHKTKMHYILVRDNGEHIFFYQDWLSKPTNRHLDCLQTDMYRICMPSCDSIYIQR